MKFEKISRFNDIDLKMPQRKTTESAGYDMYVAEDIIIMPWEVHCTNLLDTFPEDEIITLDEMAKRTKVVHGKPTLVSTGMKCKLDSGTYLSLNIRSSSPLKHWLMLANSVGIIDADYYNNPDNEGEIFFQVYNMSPYPIQLKRGDAIGQGIILPYLTTEDDIANGIRIGGFGSTDVGHTDESAMMPAT